MPHTRHESCAHYVHSSRHLSVSAAGDGLDLLVVRQVRDLDVDSGLHGDIGDLANNVLGTEQL